MNTNIVVIGAGPGGYVAAIRAAQKGKDVVLVEKGSIGGVCLNAGCIPTKALFKHALFLKDLKRANVFGINIPQYTIDYAHMLKRKDDVVKKLRSGVDHLLKKNGVKVIAGIAEIVKENEVMVTKENGSKERILCNNIIIATGSEPIIPKVEGIDNSGVLTSTGLLELDKIPESLAIIGGGVIGIEFACIFNAFGSKVYIIEKLPNILPNMDMEISASLRKEMGKNGIEFFTGCELQSILKKGDRLICVTGKGEIEVEKILVSVGRKPVLPEEHIGIELNRNSIKVNEFLQTNHENIYCIGDANGSFQLAHVASAEAIVAVENIINAEKTKMDYKTVPSVVYSIPEVASVGFSQEQAENTNDIKVGKFPYNANGKALCMEETEGFVKVISDKYYNEILGVHILGYDASNLIAEAGIALKLEATAGEIIKTIHPHPTLTETVMEACEELVFKAIHK